jgi:enamine deaminase RidA (YjgF/YER057c/UK114 family)
MEGKIQHVNPDGLSKNPAFSQAIITLGQGKTIYIGGQDALDANGQIVGKDDLKAQTKQVMQNLQTALEACGCSFDHVVKMGIYLVHGQDLRPAFEVAQQFMSKSKEQPTVTGFMVPGLAHPDYLLEVDAIAFLPD